MASVTTAQLSADADHCLADFPQTITIISPAAEAATTYAATRNTLDYGYEVEVNGREAQVTTQWYINVEGLGTYPDKGWCFSANGRNYKVWDSRMDQAEVMLKLDCIGQSQSR